MGILESLLNIPLIIIAFATIVNSIFILCSFCETRRMRKFQTDPRIAVRLEKTKYELIGFDLVIKNEGKGTAKNVEFIFKGNPEYFKGSTDPAIKINSLEIIKRGMKEIFPGSQNRYYLGTTNPEEFEEIMNNPWEIKVFYETIDNEKKNEAYIIDIYQFKEEFMEEPRMKEISKHLDSIQKSLQIISAK